MTSGTVKWELKAKDDAETVYTLSTEVECLKCSEYEDGECKTCENYSYSLRVPQETAMEIAGIESGENAIPLSTSNRQYDYANVIADGFQARILPKSQYGNIASGDPQGTFILASQPRRSHFYQVDLEIVKALEDKDNDGIPDWWEEKYGLNTNINDANQDKDNDGWDNRTEFGNGTDPNKSNTAPTLLSEKILIYESSRTIFSPIIADSDTPENLLKIKLLNIPAGIRMLFHGASTPYANGALLKASDTLLWENLQKGNVLIEHTNPSADNLSLKLALDDGSHVPFVADVPIEIFRPTVTDGTDAIYWGDGYAYATARKNGTANEKLFPDRSGNNYHATYQDGISEAEKVIPIGNDISPSGKQGVYLDGISAFVLPFATPVFPNGDATVFSVFKAISNPKDQILAAGPFFEIGITGESDPYHPNEIFVSTSTETVYGNQNATDQWMLSAVHKKNGKTRTDLNGMWTGGTSSEFVTNELGTDPFMGGRIALTWNFTTKDWEVRASDLLQKGQIGEMLVFDRELSEKEKQQVQGYLFAKWFDYVISDASKESISVYLRGASQISGTEANYMSQFLPVYGNDYSYVMIGGNGDDIVAGGYEDDILFGGPGVDDLRGLGGQDIFVLTDGDIVRDFNRNDGDILYIAHLLQDTGKPISAYVHFEILQDPATNDNHTLLKIDADGDGSGFNDAVITLRSVVLRDTNLNSLWADGYLHTGGARPAVTVSILSDTKNTGSFLLKFSGTNIPKGLTVPFAFTDASGEEVACGMDTQVYNSRTGLYEFVRIQNHNQIPIALKPGDTTLSVRVIAAGDTKSSEQSVSVSLLPKASFYDLGDIRSITLTLSDIPAIPGDIDANGVVQLRDAVVGFQVCAGMKPPAYLTGDANKDGRIGLQDIVYILQQVAK